jgi:hypothetical protein
MGTGVSSVLPTGHLIGVIILAVAGDLDADKRSTCVTANFPKNARLDSSTASIKYR